jgi:hypothetical protein
MGIEETAQDHESEDDENNLPEELGIPLATLPLLDGLSEAFIFLQAFILTRFIVKHTFLSSYPHLIEQIL